MAGKMKGQTGGARGAARAAKAGPAALGTEVVGAAAPSVGALPPVGRLPGGNRSRQGAGLRTSKVAKAGRRASTPPRINGY